MRRKRSTVRGVCLDVAACRVCMCAKGTVLLFDGRGTDEQFYYCTLLRASANDGLPGKLCRLCAKNMRVAYDFRFQAIYAEQCFRKTIFLPALENVVTDSGVGGDEREQLCVLVPAVGDQLVLDENMHEIDQLLSKKRNEFEEKPNGELLESAGGSGERKSDRAISDCESDGVSGNFIDVFSTISAQDCDAEMQIEETKEDDTSDLIQGETDIPSQTNANPISNTISVPSQPSVSDVPNANVSTGSITAAYDDDSITRFKQKFRKRKTIKVECNVCGATFSHAGSLKQHLLNHLGERPFRCEFCDKTFTRNTILSMHRRLHTGERPYRCSECVECFSTTLALNKHKEREHKERPQENSDESSKRVLQTHKRRHQSNAAEHIDTRKGKQNSAKAKRKVATKKSRPVCTVKHCHICRRGFPSKWELKAHQQEHEMTPLFECNVCHCTWEKKFQLICHLQEHDNADVLIQQCVQRGALQQEIKVLQSDVEIDAGAKSVNQPPRVKNALVSDDMKCRLCGIILPHLDALKFHMQSHASERPFKCEACNKTFTRKAVLALHRRSHALTDNLPYECPICAASCETTHMLWQHVKAVHEQHLAEKEGFCCRFCAESFATDTLLKVHLIELHSEVPLAKLHFLCNHCQQQFLRLGQFLRHFPTECPGRVRVSSVAPFECDKCQLRFKEKYKLLFHTELHKISNQACKKCGQTFGSRKLLLRHVKRVHFGRGNLDYQCPQCTEALYDMRDLKQHLSEAHAGPFDAGELNACDLCGVDCETALEFYRHMHARHDVISRTCDECGKYFDSRRAFDKHVFAHYI